MSQCEGDGFTGSQVRNRGSTDSRPRRLERARDGRIIAGVGEGLGRYFGIDPVIFRLGFVVTAFVGGAGILAYVLAYLAIPEAENPDQPASTRATRGEGWLAFLLIALGGIALADALSYASWGFATGTLLAFTATPVLLIGLGIALAVVAHAEG